MRAVARIVAVADGHGGTRLAVLSGAAPLLPRRTGPRGATAEVEVHLVGGAAGPLGGDDLRVEVRVGAQARLCVRTVAAALALPGPAGGRSRLVVDAAVEAGGSLRWLPGPLIAAAGCDHDAVSSVRVAAGGTLRWRDDLVCGRHGEAPGDARVDTTVRYAGAILYRHRLSVGPTAAGWSAAAVLGGGRAVGSLLVVDPALAAPPESAGGCAGAVAAVMPLAGPGVLVTAVGDDLRAVRAAIARITGETVP